MRSMDVEGRLKKLMLWSPTTSARKSLTEASSRSNEAVDKCDEQRRNEGRSTIEEGEV
jgi:hypothetical protein